MCAIRRNWMDDRLTDGGTWVENEKNPLFGVQSELLSRQTSMRILRILPDPLFMQNIQEFAIEQGVI